MRKKKYLTPLQFEVMRYLAHSWEARESAGIIEINGKKACNLMTMVALNRAGYVYRVPAEEYGVRNLWRVTDAGKAQYFAQGGK